MKRKYINYTNNCYAGNFNKTGDDYDTKLINRDWFNTTWKDKYHFERDWFDKKWVDRYKFGKN